MAEFRPNSLEDLCDLMCGNYMPKERRKKMKASQSDWDLIAKYTEEEENEREENYREDERREINRRWKDGY